MPTILRAPWIPLVATPYGENAVCLEICNQVPAELPAGREAELALLRAWGEWLEETGAAEPGYANRLSAEAKRQPERATSAVMKLAELRTAIFRAFSAVAAKREPPSEDLALLSRRFVEAAGSMRLRTDEPPWQWDDPMDAAVGIGAVSAVELWTSPLRERVRLCGSETCDWLFLDLSHGRTRRWCDMQTCGNRAKARRHQARRKSSPSPT